MSYAIVCDMCNAIVAQASQVFEHPPVWKVSLPGEWVVHLCGEQCLVRWVEKRRMEKVGSGELNGADNE